MFDKLSFDVGSTGEEINVIMTMAKDSYGKHKDNVVGFFNFATNSNGVGTPVVIDGIDSGKVQMTWTLSMSLVMFLVERFGDDPDVDTDILKKILEVATPLGNGASNAWLEMNDKIGTATNENLQFMWDLLKDYDPNSWYVDKVISMDMYAEAIYSEMDRRDMPHISTPKTDL